MVSLILWAALAQVDGLSPPPPPPVVEPPPPPARVEPPRPPSPPPLEGAGPLPPPFRAGPSATDQARPHSKRSFFDLGRVETNAFFWGDYLAGSVGGGIVAWRLSQNLGYTFLGVLVGGPLLAFSALTFLYFAPESAVGVGLMAALAGACALLGISIRNFWDAGTAYLALLAGAHLGLLATFLGTLPFESVSRNDGALIRMTTLTSAYVTALALWLMRINGVEGPAVNVLFAPAAGLLLGGALAALLEVDEERSNAMLGIPILASSMVGLIVHFILSDGFRQVYLGPATAITTLSVWGGMFLLTSIVRFGPRTDGSGDSLTVAPLIAPAGRRGEDVAWGASVAWRF